MFLQIEDAVRMHGVLPGRVVEVDDLKGIPDLCPEHGPHQATAGRLQDLVTEGGVSVLLVHSLLVLGADTVLVLF